MLMVYTVALVRCAANARVGATADACAWRHWVGSAACSSRCGGMRRQDLAMLKVVGRNPFPLWVLLGTSRSWIEEIIDTLESTSALPGNLGVFA